jgi:hypothetical protein
VKDPRDNEHASGRRRASGIGTSQVRSHNRSGKEAERFPRVLLRRVCTGCYIAKLVCLNSRVIRIEFPKLLHA